LEGGELGGKNSKIATHGERKIVNRRKSVKTREDRTIKNNLGSDLKKIKYEIERKEKEIIVATKLSIDLVRILGLKCESRRLNSGWLATGASVVAHLTTS